MKLFLDSAVIAEIEEAAALGIICGVTTNPSLVAQASGSAGRFDHETFTTMLHRICTLVDGPISAEVMSAEAAGMIREAEELAEIDREKIVIKIPMCAEGLKAVKTLETRGIRTNVTLVFSTPQALLAAAAGASFASPCAGRLDDIGQDGIAVIREIAEIYDYHGISTEIIAASIRHPIHVVEAAQAGADIATVPFKILQQMIQHPLTTAGIARFNADWAKLNQE